MKAELIDYLGTDLTVANAARVSFDKESSVFQERDEKLINYLASHNHFTPFTHCMITLRETVPIFVARQRFKHQIGFSYNEVSRRYVNSEPEFYYPETWRTKPIGSVKQGSGTEKLPEPVFEHGYCRQCGKKDDFGYDDVIQKSKNLYNTMIKEGYSAEQARMVLPQSMYTSYYVTGSLAAWARAYNLRSKPDAQMEIQELAKDWDRIIRPLYPISWEALT